MEEYVLKKSAKRNSASATCLHDGTQLQLYQVHGVLCSASLNLCTTSRAAGGGTLLSNLEMYIHRRYMIMPKAVH